ncbi:MAG: hypothetical protein IT204_10945 [Fimbriimonadaceae bacterium]|nr:hypothetical protein [Fimbriimonadaceae bacterium]
MSVQEILDRVKDLTAAERQLVREALQEPTGRPAETRSDLVRQSVAALRDGWIEGDGRPVADTIDAVLYGRPE